jgi:ribosome recycling factor
LIALGANASGELREDIEKKIHDLKNKKTSLEEEFRKGKERMEKVYQEKMVEMDPNLKKAKKHIKNAILHFAAALKILFNRK